MAKDRNNIIEYVETEFATFAERPFSEVDSLVLAKLSYLHWMAVPCIRHEFRGQAGPTLHDLYRAEWFAGLFETQMDRDLDRRLLAGVVASPRFRDVSVANHVDVVDEACDKQFSATTFVLPDQGAYVAFRGTDNTIVGWKEDFNLAFVTPVPSQRAARDYLERAARHLPGTLRVGGHSKGGNLAVYAAARCRPECQARIVQVYSHDGPGFNRKALEHLSSSDISGRVSKSVPESSIVGMLLEHQEPYHVVRSDEVGIMQHDPYSWLVSDGTFVAADGIDGGASLMDETLSEWIDGMDAEHIERFTNALFSVFGASGAKKFQDMTIEDYRAQAEALVGMDPDERRMFLETLRTLASIGARNIVGAAQAEVPRLPIG
ncbi:MAG: DUF2974 domain-containing protein [Atopobiaceae bacterium]|jgi:hypothetical protein|nr:DUF2974 domain-containing protein [Atopobiaceae bacterium]